MLGWCRNPGNTQAVTYKNNVSQFHPSKKGICSTYYWMDVKCSQKAGSYGMYHRDYLLMNLSRNRFAYSYDSLHSVPMRPYASLYLFFFHREINTYLNSRILYFIKTCCSVSSWSIIFSCEKTGSSTATQKYAVGLTYNNDKMLPSRCCCYCAVVTSWTRG